MNPIAYRLKLGTWPWPQPKSLAAAPLAIFRQALTLFTLCALLCGYLPAAAPTRPNIVFILADDLGWSDTTLYGKTKFYQTPNLERLAKRGMLFTRAYSASPLCSPTRASILTGQNPARIGITAPNCHLPQVKLEASCQAKAPATHKALPCESATRLNTNYFTLAEALKQAGYATGHFGKWHLGAEPFSPLQQGFEVDLPHWPGPGPAGSYVAPWKFKDFDNDPGVPNQHIEDRMAKEAVAFMEKHKNGPFFLNYWMFSVHAPFDAKKALIEKHRGRVNPNDPQHSPTYAAMVESMDDAIGTLLDALDRLGIAERTAVVFYSDNGGNMYNEIDGTTPTSNAPLRGGKATVYEGGIRVPCIVSWPQITARGSRNDTIIQTTDFYPTFLELLGLKPQPGQIFDGTSIAEVLRGKPLAREAIFTYFPHSPKVPDHLPPAVTVHSGDWKLIRIFHEGEKGAHAYQLYNLKEDLSETNNLAARQPDRVRQLDALIQKFLTDTKAVVPKPNPAYNATAAADGANPQAGSTDPLLGWKARGCEATVKEGVLTVSGTGNAPFLGFGAGKLSGPATVAFRSKSTVGGPGKVEWLPTPQAADKAKSVSFQLKGGDWQEVRVELPAEGALGIIRLYLPAGKEPVSLDWVELKPAKTKLQRWDF
jgi:arylsulfatase A-like enzyme